VVRFTWTLTALFSNSNTARAGPKPGARSVEGYLSKTQARTTV
jgi:hypothetical protein